MYIKKSDRFLPNKVPLSQEYRDESFKNPNDDPKGHWQSVAITVSKGHQGKGYEYAIETPSGEKIKRTWLYPKDSFERMLKDGRIYFGVNGSSIPRRIIYLDEIQGQTPDNLWLDVATNREGKLEVVNIFDEDKFGTPKPERLMQRVFTIGSSEGDIVLDFFAGSGTSGAVAMKMQRQFILCEQMDYVEKVTIERLKKVLRGEKGGISETVGWKGGADFVYCELMRYNERFVDEIEKAKDAKTLLKIWEDMKAKSFFNYSIDLKAFEENIAEFKVLPLGKQKSVLVQTLNKNQLYVNLSEIDDMEFKVGKEDKEMNRKFYGENHV